MVRGRAGPELSYKPLWWHIVFVHAILPVQVSKELVHLYSWLGLKSSR
jgi:hypothetical protein